MFPGDGGDNENETNNKQKETKKSKLLKTPITKPGLNTTKQKLAQIKESKKWKQMASNLNDPSLENEIEDESNLFI